MPMLLSSIEITCNPGRLAAKLDNPTACRVNMPTVAMPCGQAIEAALAILLDG